MPRTETKGPTPDPGIHHPMLRAIGESAASRAILAAMQEGVVVLDQGGAIVTCNAAAERILGMSQDQMHGRTSMDPRWRTIRADGEPYPGDQHPAMVTLRTGQPRSNVIMGVHKRDGSLTWISINSQPIGFDAEGKPIAAVTTFTDVTEARQRAEALHASHRRLELVLEGNNDGCWDWHVPSGRVIFSARWYTMLGYEPGEFEPHVRSWEALVHPEDIAEVHRCLSAHLRGETGHYETEHRVRAKDGHWLWVLDRGKVVERDAAGNPVRAAGTHTDIDARRGIEQRLREALQLNERLVDELRVALSRVKTLGGLLPVCAWCKNVRDDAGYWQQIEIYLAEHTDARFTHGLCPTCDARLSGECEPT